MNPSPFHPSPLAASHNSLPLRGPSAARPSRNVEFLKNDTQKRSPSPAGGPACRTKPRGASSPPTCKTGNLMTKNPVPNVQRGNREIRWATTHVLIAPCSPKTKDQFTLGKNSRQKAP